MISALSQATTRQLHALCAPTAPTTNERASTDTASTRAGELSRPAPADPQARAQDTHADTYDQPLDAPATTRAQPPLLALTRQIPEPSVPPRPHDRVDLLLRLAQGRESQFTVTRAARRCVLLWLPLIVGALLCADVVVRNRSLLRPDLLARLDQLLPSALGVLLVAGLATFLATAPGAPALCPRATALRWSALCTGPVTTLPVLFLAKDNKASAAAAQQLNSWGFPCFFLAYLIAVFSLVVLARELRRPLPALASWRGAALGSAAGSWSALALLLHCPGAEPQHLLVGHVLPVCALPLLGLLFARQWLRVA